ncbi:Vesicle-associated protein 2-1 [Zea mays]|uniref:Vesicle-associated protein 2-1 n=2 Tax=Zea mays TaxID=4577 RepID=A0A1D6GRB5_MAIZE|nr:Vesicle-associated protein 2-1 [Zea mays]
MLQAAAPPSEAPMMQISPAPIPIFAAFQVKTTSPRKYFVQPNASIVQPWDSCTIMITLQAQKDYPPYMQCKDKFLIQSTKVAANTEMDEIPPDTFNKEADKVIEEMKLKVVYTLPSCGGSDDSSVSFLGSRSFKAASDDLMMLKNASLEEVIRSMPTILTIFFYFGTSLKTSEFITFL